MNNDPHNGEHDLPQDGPVWGQPAPDTGWADAGLQPGGHTHPGGTAALPPYAAQVPTPQAPPPPPRRRRGPWVWIVPLVAGIVAMATAAVLVTAKFGDGIGSGRTRAAGSAAPTATGSAGATPSQAATTTPQPTVFRTVSAGRFSVRAPDSLTELPLTKEAVAAARTQAKEQDEPGLQAVLEQVDGLQDEGGVLALYSRGLAVDYVFVAALPVPVHGTIPQELRAGMVQEFNTDGGKVTGTRDRTIGGRRCFEISATQKSEGVDIPATVLFIPGDTEIYYVVAVLLSLDKADTTTMLDSIRIR